MKYLYKSHVITASSKEEAIDKIVVSKLVKEIEPHLKKLTIKKSVGFFIIQDKYNEAKMYISKNKGSITITVEFSFTECENTFTSLNYKDIAKFITDSFNDLVYGNKKEKCQICNKESEDVYVPTDWITFSDYTKNEKTLNTVCKLISNDKKHVHTSMCSKCFDKLYWDRAVKLNSKKKGK